MASNHTFSTHLDRWAPPIIWMILIFTLSSYSTLPGPQVFFWDFILKKTAHLLEYAVLFILLARTFNWGIERTKWVYINAAIIAVIYAFTDELHQASVPGRHSQLLDIGYDSLGIFIAYIYSLRLLF